MRNVGTLTKWNANRGFGFILPNQTTVEVFVHITAFPRDGVRPTVGETLTFETALNKGKLCAVKIQRPSQQRTGRRWIKTMIAVVLIGIAGYIAYSYFG
ncbi:MAG: cold shock domain-containing protein [Arenimonas sp.]|nr:cold shock domain-containing protein [Arenimonas sp.]